MTDLEQIIENTHFLFLRNDFKEDLPEITTFELFIEIEHIYNIFTTYLLKRNVL